MNELSLSASRTGMELLPTESIRAGSRTSPESESVRTWLPSLGVRTILVPIDFSEVSAVIVRRMAEFAERVGAALHILHVVEPSGRLTTEELMETRVDRQARAGAAPSELRQWVEQVLPGHISVTTTVRVGRAADEIVAQARVLQVNLIVMSAHVGQGLKNVLVRTTTERVVRQASCPVLVVAKDKVNDFLQKLDGFPPPSWKRILLPVDLSSRVPGALAYAAAIAMENSAKLHLLHAVASDTLTGETLTPSAVNRLTEWLRTELRWPVESESTVWTDTPLLHAIMTEAGRSKVDVIVLPTRDGTWSRRHRLWSVTDGILRHAPCPVLCVNENANLSGG